MPRRPRIELPEIPQHVVQRGNNRADCFLTDDDRGYYLHLLREACAQHDAALHAYVLMSNHVHLLISPLSPGAVSRVMQVIGRAYVPSFNRRNGRTGTLWEGRFKSCLVESDAYALCAMRYIELNPVRAGMVERPADYVWSSHRCNASGRGNGFLTAVSSYLALGSSSGDRARVYRSMFERPPIDEEADALRAHTIQGVPWGCRAFRAALQAKVTAFVGLRTVGRPSRPKREKSI